MPPVRYVHSKRMILCDIQATNVFVNRKAHLKLPDFQGRYLSEDGDVKLGGLASRVDISVREKTYLWLTSRQIYLRLDNEVRSRFEGGVFPNDSFAHTIIAQKCWKEQYDSEGEVLKDIRVVSSLS
ncbi:hypothetical protein LZ32DRAFT_632034 [Colletotrichum eremochloae]|nr:hypothetical protein LZ32DRAFT_632034 [Colletotrichum eremochloae]